MGKNETNVQKNINEKKISVKKNEKILWKKQYKNV